MMLIRFLHRAGEAYRLRATGVSVRSAESLEHYAM